MSSIMRKMRKMLQENGNNTKNMILIEVGL